LQPRVRHAERLRAGIGHQRREAAHHQHVAVRELDDVEHAEEQREAHRDHRVDHA